MTKADLVHVTGFGPFEDFEEINPSWEAVALLPDQIEVEGISYEVRKHKVPVTYAAVNEILPKLWADNPKVSLHPQQLDQNLIALV